MESRRENRYDEGEVTGSAFVGLLRALTPPPELYGTSCVTRRDQSLIRASCAWYLRLQVASPAMPQLHAMLCRRRACASRSVDCCSCCRCYRCCYPSRCCYRCCYRCYRCYCCCHTISCCCCCCCCTSCSCSMHVGISIRSRCCCWYRP